MLVIILHNKEENCYNLEYIAKKPAKNTIQYELKMAIINSLTR